MDLLLFLAVSWPSIYYGLFALARLSRVAPIVIFSFGLLGTFVAGHWSYLHSLPEGLRSDNWPSTEASLVRVHATRYLGIKWASQFHVLQMPYLYSVDGKNYRGTRYNVAGDFVGTYPEITAITDDRSAVFRAYYNPRQPADAVLVPGPAPTSFNLHTLLPATLFGLFLFHSLLRWRRRKPVDSAPLPKPSVILKLAVALISLAFLLDLCRWYIGSEAHGVNGDYAVLREEPMADGVEYWIAVGLYWSLW